VRWRYVWIVIRSGYYVQQKAGRNDRRTWDRPAVDLYYTCHIGQLTNQ